MEHFEVICGMWGNICALHIQLQLRYAILLRGIKTKQALPLCCINYFSTCLPNAQKKGIIFVLYIVPFIFMIRNIILTGRYIPAISMFVGRGKQFH